MEELIRKVGEFMFYENNIKKYYIKNGETLIEVDKYTKDDLIYLSDMDFYLTIKDIFVE